MDVTLLANGDLQVVFDQDTSLDEAIEKLEISNEKKKHVSFLLKNEPVQPGQIIPKKARLIVRLDDSFRMNDQTPVYTGALPVVYEDDWSIVVNKKPFMLVHSDGNEEDTLEARVNAYLQQQNYPFAAHASHRIDREASGLVLFCKYPLLQSYFDRQFEDGTAVKEYLSVVDGRVQNREADINNPIGRNRHDAKKMIVNSKGKPARTHIKRLKLKDDKSLVLARIYTGRKHQIRVHMANLGYPVFNDPLYGLVHNNKGLFLQSFRLQFVPAFSNEPMTLQLPMDSRFKWFQDVDLQEV